MSVNDLVTWCFARVFAGEKRASSMQTTLRQTPNIDTRSGNKQLTLLIYNHDVKVLLLLTGARSSFALRFCSRD